MASHCSRLCCMSLLVAAHLLPSLAVRDETQAVKARVSNAAAAARGSSLGGSFDWAHEGIWKYFQGASIVEDDQQDLQGTMGSFSVKANGEQLIEITSVDGVQQDIKRPSAHRPGFVNTNRLRVEVHGANGDVTVTLLQGSDTKRKAVCAPSETRATCTLDTEGDTAIRHREAVAVNFHSLPPNAEFILMVTATKGDLIPDDWEDGWVVFTADGASGDAQGRAHFLPKDYVPDTNNHADKHKMVEKEMTVYDLSRGGSSFNILDHGFEVDRSDDLAGHVEELMKIVRGPGVEVSVEIRHGMTAQSVIPGHVVASTGMMLAYLPPDQQKMALNALVEDVTLIQKVVHATGAATRLLQQEAKRASSWWKKKYPDSKAECACFSLQFRCSQGEDQLGALPVAHVDATSVPLWFGGEGKVTETWFEHHFDMSMAETLGHVALTYNKWVNANDKPIVHQPLMVMDTKTLGEDDLAITRLQADLESMILRWNSRQKWYYTKLGRGQGYIFSTSPHKGLDGVEFTGTPHSAFDFKTAKQEDPEALPEERESFEMRCLLVDKTKRVGTATTGEYPPVKLSSPEQAVQAVVSDMKRLIKAPINTPYVTPQKKAPATQTSNTQYVMPQKKAPAMQTMTTALN
mmetsp:Transcript_82568/g.233917  ORF Transcript_82568/g.233917 Transcript_82568/m.233917 type:complete len:632 (-) Transcript_82568:136-2031(-)